MIFTFLIVLIVALILANLFISYKDKTNYDKQHHSWGNKNAVAVEVVKPVETKKPTEQEFLNFGKVIANEQKIKILNERVITLENALSAVAKKGLQLENHEEVDYERIEFKIKLLEQEIDDIKNPKPKPTTFYGQENDPMEATIKSLVFNSTKKK